jgi:DNA-binding NarL/FixJ family response regulator
VRLLIVDDHEVVRIGLRTLLESEGDIEVVGEAGSVADAVSECRRLEPDIVLMDVRLPDGTGVDACRRLRQEVPHCRVLILTSFADSELVVEAIEAGAAGYVLKQLDTEQLLRAIRGIRDGDSVLDPSVTPGVLARVREAARNRRADAFADLTPRELEVLEEVARGLTNAEIADRLVLSEKTVRNHISAILAKLNVGNRTEAATYAVRHGIADTSTD